MFMERVHEDRHDGGRGLRRNRNPNLPLIFLRAIVLVYGQPDDGVFFAQL